MLVTLNYQIQILEKQQCYVRKYIVFDSTRHQYWWNVRNQTLIFVQQFENTCWFSYIINTCLMPTQYLVVVHIWDHAVAAYAYLVFSYTYLVFLDTCNANLVWFCTMITMKGLSRIVFLAKFTNWWLHHLLFCMYN